MRWIPASLIAGILLAPACGHDPLDASAPHNSCADGQRQVVFRLDFVSDITRCVEFDTLVAAASPACTVSVWRAPRNQRNDELFRYEASAADTTQPCGDQFFFGVVQNSVGGYTYFDGKVRRAFGSGSGPFAAGVYEVLDGRQVLVGFGRFEFWE